MLVLESAGWHDSGARAVPDSITRAPLPPPDHVLGRLCGPEFDPVEPVRLHLRERLLSLRLRDETEAIIAACRDAGNALTAETGRLRPRCAHPRITKIRSRTRRYNEGSCVAGRGTGILAPRVSAPAPGRRGRQIGLALPDPTGSGIVGGALSWPPEPY